MRDHIVGLFVLAVAAVVACGEPGPQPTPIPPAAVAATAPTTAIAPALSPTALPTLTPTPPLTPPPAFAATPTAGPLSAQDILQASAEAMDRVETFHFDMALLMSVESEGITLDLPMSYTGDFQAPDRSQGSISISLGFLTIEFQTIKIGDTLYETDPDTGKWGIGTEEDALFGDSADLATIDLSGLEDLALVGEDTLDGTRVYQITGTARAQAQGEQGVETAITHWVGVEDGLLRQVVTEGTIDPRDGPVGPFGPAGEGTATISITLKLSEFGKPVSIEAPELAP